MYAAKIFKNLLLSLFIIVLSLAITAARPQAYAAAAEETIILATTYSVYDTGLLDVLIKDFKAKTAITIKPIVVGSGESIKMGERAECDVIIAHSKDLEEKFMADEYGKDRKSIARNEFYIIGPKNDPAGIKSAKDVFEAYSKIDTNGVFISRGDKSGTHNREMSIWKKAGIEKKPSEKYIVTGQGMSETLKIADEKQAYTMCDSATYAVMKDKIKTVKLFQDGKNLTNIYSVITLNPEKNNKVKYDSAKKFFDYVFSGDTLSIIEKYGADKYGEPLFILLDSLKSENKSSK
ncbi:MAG: substrate-binding domain-containing protein [Candidatus Wallbacteria bacterium]